MGHPAMSIVPILKEGAGNVTRARAEGVKMRRGGIAIILMAMTDVTMMTITIGGDTLMESIVGDIASTNTTADIVTTPLTGESCDYHVICYYCLCV